MRDVIRVLVLLCVVRTSGTRRKPRWVGGLTCVVGQGGSSGVWRKSGAVSRSSRGISFSMQVGKQEDSRY